jgi:ketosteroid isomerase-like protein
MSKILQVPEDRVGLTFQRFFPDGANTCMNASTIGAALTAATLLTVPTIVFASPEQDRAEVAAMDTKYQAAVKRNDAPTMGQILHEDFILVLGSGQTQTRADLLNEARSGRIRYEQQDEDPGTQTVRVWGDTAVVTARLWLKYTVDGKAFDRRLWFSDTYVRTAQGWRYVFGQASLPLPAQ